MMLPWLVRMSVYGLYGYLSCVHAMDATTTAGAEVTDGNGRNDVGVGAVVIG